MVVQDFGIVTLCDKNYYPGLLMLHRSVQESYPCPIVCYDLGLTPEQKAFAARQKNLYLLALPDDPLIGRIQAVMGRSAPLMKMNKRVWPLWICPLLIRHAPLRNVFWMDCDIVVLRGLADLFDALREGPVFTPESKAPELTPNRPELYDLLPIGRPFDPLRPTVNAGVSGWNKARDTAAIDAYVFPVQQAIENERVRDAISWHDQGALIWAIQACGLEHRVAPTTSWNLCVDHTALSQNPIAWDIDFLTNARQRERTARVVHWNGREPPWV